MLPADWHRRYDGLIERERLLKPLTTWRIGGPAEFYFEPGSAEAVADTVAVLTRIGMPYRILGGGSNLLVADRGVRGAVISLNRLNCIVRDGDGLLVEAGAFLHGVVRYAAAEGLSGAEPLAGIPGRVGGAVFGNAGGKHGDIGQLVTHLDLVGPDGFESIRPGPGFFRYRASDVGERTVLRARLALEPAARHDVRRRNLEIVKERRSSQPGWVGNAGCVFRNPERGSAGRLIDASGCKGLREGAVYVSPTHANFMENDGAGTESDVRRLIDRVRARVDRAFDVELEMEVRQWH
jgi:UDP-N-acetylmuramate dehydrogenase